MHAESPPACEAVKRDILTIWREVYLKELGWLSHCDESSLSDAYADRSSFIVAYDSSGVTPIGTARMVKSLGRSLPVERFVSLDRWCKPDLPKVELTRLMVRQNWRKQSSVSYPFGVYRALMRAAFRWAHAQSMRYLVLNVRARGTPNSIIDSLDAYGFSDTGVRIPDEFNACFPDCSPVIIDVKEFFRVCCNADDPLLAYTTSKCEISDELVRICPVDAARQSAIAR